MASQTKRPGRLHIRSLKKGNIGRQELKDLTAIFSLLGMDSKGQRCKPNCVAHVRVQFCDRWGTIGTYIVVQLIPSSRKHRVTMRQVTVGLFSITSMREN